MADANQQQLRNVVSTQTTEKNVMYVYDDVVNAINITEN